HRGRDHGREEVMAATAVQATPAPVPASAPKVRKPRKTERVNPMVYVVAWLLVGICIGPVLYLILGGLRTNSQITQDPSGFPTTWEWGNYSSVLESSIFWQQFGNSAI